MAPFGPELNTGPPRGRDGAKLKFIGTSSIPLPAARINRTHVVDLDVIGLRQVEFGLLRRDAELQRLHHGAVFGPANVLFIVVAHHVNVVRTACQHERIGVSLRDRAIGCAETPLRGSSPFGPPSLTRGGQTSARVAARGRLVGGEIE